MSARRPLLSRRVALLALAVIAGWLVVLMSSLNLIVDHELRSDLTGTLKVRAQAALATVEVSGHRITKVHDVANDAELDNGVWVVARGRTVEPAGVATAPAVVLSVANRPAGAVSQPGQQLFYVLPVRAGDGSRVGAVVVAAGTEGIHRAAVLTLIGSIVVGGLLLLGMYVVLRLTIVRALRPVADMTGQAQAWSIGDPGKRFGADQRFEELAALAHTLDALLDRVAGVLRHEQVLTAELSHELRTPLARVVAELSLLTGEDDRVDPRALEGIRESSTRMQRIIETLLTSARSQHAENQGRCAVADAIATEVSSLRHADVDFRTDVNPADLHAGVDQGVCERIIAPILDNAARFAATWVMVRAYPEGGRVIIEVSNDGPPIAPVVADAMFVPGRHSPDPSGHDGSGLGLPLSRRLARAVDGDLHLSAHEPVSFVIELPS